MAKRNLLPQLFSSEEKIALEEYNIYNMSLALLPSAYRDAPKFLEILKVTTDIYQHCYDILRSMTNILNFKITDKYTQNVCAGEYLRMCANILGVQYNSNDSDDVIRTACELRVIYLNSRGTPNNYYAYFLSRGWGSLFVSENFSELGNCTIKIKVPLDGVGLDQVVQDLSRIKCLGVKIVVEPVNIKTFEYSAENGSYTADGAGAGGFNKDNVVVPQGYLVKLNE